MARVPDLSGVDSTTGECAKLDCNSGSRTLHRHHRKHQAMWIGVWRVRRAGEEKFLKFCYNYHAFLRKDWDRICDRHHAEIHLIYDMIIQQDVARVGRPLAHYSWAQAEKLMAKLEATCVEWLKKDTPGLDPEKLNDIRDRRLVVKMNAKGEIKYVRAKDGGEKVSLPEVRRPRKGAR